MTGWTDTPARLTDSDALERLRAALPAEAVVVSSDLARAVQTADALAGARARLPRQRGLREIHFGAWEGRTLAELQAEAPEELRRYWESPGTAAPPGGESWDELAARVSAVVDDLTGAAGDIVAVAHFGPILTQIQRATGQGAAEMLATRIDNLSLTRLAFDGAWHVDGVNVSP